MSHARCGGNPGDAGGEVRGVYPHLDERQRRRLLEAEARALAMAESG
jgi:surface antigen